MKIKDPDLAIWLQRFFREHLAQQRNVSSATIQAYRDTFRLLVHFLRKKHRRVASVLSIELLTSVNVLAFLKYLESQRRNAIRTRNARLAGIRSFVRYLDDWLGPDLPSATRCILAIPFKRHARPMIGYLKREEVHAIIDATDNTWTGHRDRLLFLLLYNTGARISEILNLRVRDVLGGDAKYVELHGKGRKHRTLPVWPETQVGLRRWIRQNSLPPEAPLFANRFGQPLTRSGAAKKLRQLVDRTKVRHPNLQTRRVSPHHFRHSLAAASERAKLKPTLRFSCGSMSAS